MSGDQLAFLRAINEDPLDGALRLVYADWLDDHGQHEEATRQRNWQTERDESEAYLRDFACKIKPYTAHDDSPESKQAAFDQLLSDLKNGEIIGHGNEISCIRDIDDLDELKRHAENYLGLNINWDDFSFYCGC